MKDVDSLLYIFPKYLREIWGQAVKEYRNLEEIRLRAGKPVTVKLHSGEFFLDGDGILTKRETASFQTDGKMLLDILNHICQDSLYAYEDEMKQGFLTVSGGHRVGVTGQIVLDDDGKIRTMKHISGMNIRIAHEVKGAADEILPYLYENGSFINTLIISPPGCGKTTLLRDIVRQLSDGNAYGEGVTVGVVDERSEIGGSYLGIPQNDVGIRTDILDACPKIFGMMMLIRSMSPKVIAIDELGGKSDVQAMKTVSACGCGLLATIHGENVEQVLNKDFMKKTVEDGLFSRYIVMDKRDGCPKVRKIYKKELDTCYG